MAKDLSGMVSNPYANLGVATQAAEIQIEQADIALANTLDTLRATGASAGGATALAQAALQSKKGVSANIEQQEAQNEKLRAQGEGQLQKMKMNEALRIQNLKLSEQGRMQQAGVEGQKYMFNAKDKRESEQLDRLSAQISGQQRIAAQASADRSAITASTISGIGGIATSLIGSEAFGGNSASSAQSSFDFGTPGFSDQIANFDLNSTIDIGGIGGNASGFDISNYTSD